MNGVRGASEESEESSRGEKVRTDIFAILLILVAANANIWIADSVLKGPFDRALMAAQMNLGDR